MSFKIGDKVILISNKHGDGNCNPLWGGKCGYINGIIIENHTRTSLPYRVQWDNGIRNRYGKEDLRLAQPVKFILEV